MNLPARGGEAVADCFFEPASETPDFSSVAAAHTEIRIKSLSSTTSSWSCYLEQGEEITLEQLHEPFERALRAGHLIPVCFVSAKTGRRACGSCCASLRELMPNPLEGNPPEFVRAKGRRASRSDGRRPLHRPRVQAHGGPVRGPNRGVARPRGRGHDRRPGLHRRATQGREARAPVSGSRARSSARYRQRAAATCAPWRRSTTSTSTTSCTRATTRTSSK